jgi:hypothetical protein
MRFVVGGRRELFVGFVEMLAFDVLLFGLLFPFLQKIGPADAQKLRERVAAEIKTTFASHYTKVVSLREALQLPNIVIYGKRATGEKFLIDPSKLP